MDPNAITLITTALTAGAIAGLQETTSTAVKDAYNNFKTLILRNVTHKPKVEETLQDYEQDQEAYEKPLKKILTSEGIDQNPEVIEAAHQFILQLQQQSSPEQFNFQNYGKAQGTIQGNYGTVNQTFDTSSQDK